MMVATVILLMPTSWAILRRRRPCLSAYPDFPPNMWREGKVAGQATPPGDAVSTDPAPARRFHFAEGCLTLCAMKFPRTLRLDQSDPQVFPAAAEPGEWAIPGSFAFADSAPEAITGKAQQAFANGWLGLESFGRATLVEVADITDAELARLIERLAQHFLSNYHAPDLAQALPVARAEIDDAASLCPHKVHTLLAIERLINPAGEIVERVRVVEPQRAQEHTRIW